MLKNIQVRPITGTFVNMLISDTGISNAGLKEWEQDFRMMKILGITGLFVIRTEFEQDGLYMSAEDPRSTTWEDDDCLLDMVFRLADKYNMELFLGGPLGMTNLHSGDWKQEVDDNKRYYDRVMEKYSMHSCLKGLYVSLEALPWHFNFLDICTEVLKYMRECFPQYKTFMSPSLGGPVGDMKQSYSPEKWIDIYGRYFFERVAGMLDYCAPQDKIAIPCCRDGQILDNGLAEWYHIVGNLFAKCGIELWSNIETFQRPFPGHGEPHGIFRQIDYRSLYMKLQEASSLTKRLVTYDFFTCMSPNTEWGSSGRALARYMEIIGQDTALINEIYHR